MRSRMGVREGDCRQDREEGGRAGFHDQRVETDPRPPLLGDHRHRHQQTGERPHCHWAVGTTAKTIHGRKVRTYDIEVPRAVHIPVLTCQN